MPSLPFHFGSHRMEFGSRARVMGIVNVTPDSFSDGGQFLDVGRAVDHALRLVEEGADVLDVGGESSRPGASPVSLEDELLRVVPVVRELAKRTAVPISIDTIKAEVARQCLDTGAMIINDITGLRGDPQMVAVARQFAAGVVVMHMQGTPQTMQQAPTYTDVVREVSDFFRERINTLRDEGIDPRSIMLDPGIGFGKTSTHNLVLLNRMYEFQLLGRPVCLGISRKGLIGKILQRPPEERMIGSLAAGCYAVARGGAQLLRVHDVAPTVDAVQILAVIADPESHVASLG